MITTHAQRMIEHWQYVLVTARTDSEILEAGANLQYWLKKRDESRPAPAQHVQNEWTEAA